MGEKKKKVTALQTVVVVASIRRATSGEGDASAAPR
jgi:hypothetical protein